LGFGACDLVLFFLTANKIEEVSLYFQQYRRSSINFLAEALFLLLLFGNSLV
jgi:hypothetical protein